MTYRTIYSPLLLKSDHTQNGGVNPVTSALPITSSLSVPFRSGKPERHVFELRRRCAAPAGRDHSPARDVRATGKHLGRQFDEDDFGDALIPTCGDVDSSAHRLRRARRQYPIGLPYVFAMDVPVGPRQHESGSASFSIRRLDASKVRILLRRNALTWTVGGPRLLEIDPAVGLRVRQSGRMHGQRDDVEWC